MAQLNYCYIESIELGLTKQDVVAIAQPCCDNTDACEMVAKKKYIQRQLENVPTEKIADAVKSYAVTLNGNETREGFIVFLLWLMAWNIADEKSW